jgi:hypothetical protein
MLGGTRRDGCSCGIPSGAMVSTCMLGGTRRCNGDGCSCGIPSESHGHERPPLTISPLRAQPLRVDLAGEIDEISEISEIGEIDEIGGAHGQR